jgi:hypothetical protein
MGQMNTPGRYKEMKHRCPRLGGPVSFEYCRYHASEKNPCWKILDCWWESFDVVALLTKELGEKAVKQLANTRPPPKTESLMTLIQQAQKRCAED